MKGGDPHCSGAKGAGTELDQAAVGLAVLIAN